MTRPSPWDDETRDRALQLAEHEDSLCPCGCGLPMDVAHTEAPFVVDKFVCYAGRAKQLKALADQAEAKKADKPEGWNAGLHYTVRPHTPDPKEG